MSLKAKFVKKTPGAQNSNQVRLIYTTNRVNDNYLSHSGPLTTINPTTNFQSSSYEEPHYSHHFTDNNNHLHGSTENNHPHSQSMERVERSLPTHEIRGIAMPKKRVYDSRTQEDDYSQLVPNDEDELNVENLSFGLMNGPPLKKRNVELKMDIDFKNGVCPLRLGRASYHANPEELAEIDKKLADATHVRLQMDYSEIDSAITSGRNVDTKELLFGLRGLMMMNERLQEKLITMKHSVDLNRICATLNVEEFLAQPTRLVKSLDNSTDINVNECLNKFMIKSNTVQGLVNQVSNQWLDEIMPESERFKYSLSTKPQRGNIPFPARLLNPAIALFLECVKVEDAESFDTSQLKHAISKLFKEHIDQLFGQARYQLRKSQKQNPGLM